ncbi:L,D-transpeptidase family protein [Prosthecomicrobium sp. N25]|uniref:L,D-transpeptidase family protein n=1 Tax=Prosthecomicrobium sp. N25 TaxID=3129254 RepID=UPI0030777C39
MIRRSWSSFVGGTALALLMVSAVAAEEAARVTAPAAEPSAGSSSGSEIAERAVETAPHGVSLGQAGALADPAPNALAGELRPGIDATVAAAPEPVRAEEAPDLTLSNPIVLPTEAPPVPAIAAAPAPEPPTAAEIAARLPHPLTLPTDAPAMPSIAAAPAPAAPVPAATPVPAAQPVRTGSVTAVAPQAAAALAVPDDALAAAIQAAVADFGRDKATGEERKTRAAIQAFYEGRAYQPVWTGGSGLTERARSAADRFGRAGEDGLDASDYAVRLPAPGASAADLAQVELAFAQSALRYASHAMSGRFDPTRLSALVTAKPPQIDPAAVLAETAAATDVSAALQAYNPPHEGYRRLRARLAQMERPVSAGVATPLQARVPDGPSLKPGQRDERVAVLRERLGVGTSVSDADSYDPALVEAVRAFQRENGIKATGVVGPATLAALNGPASAGAAPAGAGEPKVADIIANMERWRWLPRDLGSLHVFVNIPDFHLDVVAGGRAIHRTRVIVGKVQNQTPVFSETMTHIIVNPYWNVPVSILKKEMLDKIQATSGAYLDRGNYEVVVGSKVVSASAVDWSTVNPAAVRVRQRPGGGNALGNIKFMFPNQHSVYLHDTSSRGLFQQSYRALSHGCVRVNEPFAFADAVLSEEPSGLDGSKLKAMVGGSERWLWLKRKLEVHLAYFTVFVADDGHVESRADVYGHNEKTKRLLGL